MLSFVGWLAIRVIFPNVTALGLGTAVNVLLASVETNKFPPEPAPLPAHTMFAFALETSTLAKEVTPQPDDMGVSVQVPPKSEDFHTPAELTVYSTSGACFEHDSLDKKGK